MSMSSSMTGADPAYGGAANVESSRSAVSWGAIFSGAVAALSITLVLVALGAGLGLTAISPWPNSNPTATKFALTTAIGLIVVQWLSACVGGYMAGRLRTKWVGVHTHEVFFRDTAHGFLAWALASVAGAMFLASAGASIVGGSMHAAAGIAAGGAQGAAHGAASQDMSRVTPYDVDSLFRSDHPEQGTPDTSTAQATHILAAGFANGDVPSADRDYLAQLVATRTGLAQPDARKRVDDVVRDIGGKIQDAAGGLTGDTATQVRGKINQAAGQAQQVYGDALDEVTDFTKEQPLVALVTAMGMGVILGFIMGRR
jgi:uncharacterized protein YjbJ (UPF0337 family)